MTENRSAFRKTKNLVHYDVQKSYIGFFAKIFHKEVESSKNWRGRENSTLNIIMPNLNFTHSTICHWRCVAEKVVSAASTTMHIRY